MYLIVEVLFRFVALLGDDIESGAMVVVVISLVSDVGGWVTKLVIERPALLPSTSSSKERFFALICFVSRSTVLLFAECSKSAFWVAWTGGITVGRNDDSPTETARTSFGLSFVRVDPSVVVVIVVIVFLFSFM